MITYTPTTNGQVSNYKLAPGYYTATVTGAEEAWSKAGNAMILLTLSVRGLDGPVKLIDRLVLTEKAAWKIDQFRFAVGESVTPGEPVNLDPALWVGKVLWVKTTLEPGEKPGVEFPRVEQFLREADCPLKGPLPERPQAAATKSNRALPAAVDYDDDIPF